MFGLTAGEASQFPKGGYNELDRANIGNYFIVQFVDAAPPVANGGVKQ